MAKSPFDAATGTAPPPALESSPRPTTESPRSLRGTEHAAPSAVLKEALATTILSGSYTLDAEDSGDYPTAGGLDISSYGLFLGGDRGCLATLSPHTAQASAYAYVAMSNSSTRFTQVTESYATVADARKVMRENRAQGETCRTSR